MPEVRLLYRHTEPTKKAATEAITEDIERFSNKGRRQSALDDISPLEHELESARTELAA